MRKRVWRILIAVSVIGALAACGSDKKDEGKNTTSSASAEATITVEQDRVDYRAGGGDYTPVTAPQVVKTGDAVRTDEAGRALLTFFTGTEVEILPGAELEIASFEETSSGAYTISLRQLSGETEHRVARIVDAASRYEVNTPSATLLVRGTAFGIEVAPDGATHVEVTEGVVQAQIGQQTYDVNAGEAFDIAADQTVPSTPYPIPAIRPPAATPRPAAEATEAPTPTASQRSK